MQKLLLLIALTFCLQACFLGRDFRKNSFTYTQAGKQSTLPIIVPKGVIKEDRQDTAGISLHSFQYADGAVLYFAHVADTTVALQPINRGIHQPLKHRLGGTVFKGQDADELFYREIRQGPLRIGYKNVPGAVELLFDSATNFASLQKK